jgi:hypothetical protein
MKEFNGDREAVFDDELYEEDKSCGGSFSDSLEVSSKGKTKYKSNGWNIHDDIFVHSCSFTNFYVSKVYMPMDIWNKIMAITTSLDTEWGGYLKAQKDDNGDWKIQNLVVPKQKAGAAFYEVDKSENKDYEGVVHSHVDMNASFSSIDEEYINANHEFSIVVNKSAQMSVVIRVKLPCGMYNYAESSVVISNLGEMLKGYIASILKNIKEV